MMARATGARHPRIENNPSTVQQYADDLNFLEPEGNFTLTYSKGFWIGAMKTGGAVYFNNQYFDFCKAVILKWLSREEPANE